MSPARQYPIRYRPELMVGDGVAAKLILDARTRARLSQADLALRAKTTQSAVAAYERSRRQPTLPTLCRLLHAAGFDLHLKLTRAGSGQSPPQMTRR